MQEKTYQTRLGKIYYWISRCRKPNARTLCFLPGLTADHTLFAPQIAYFAADYDVLVWDAPAHGKSRPFELTFTMKDLADFLHGILQAEKIHKPILVGQSFGGYIGQMYIELYPSQVSHFVSIGSVPLQRRYFKKWEIWGFQYSDKLFRLFPWRWLVKSAVNTPAVSPEGKNNMQKMIEPYGKEEYLALSGFGIRIIGDAIEQNYAYHIPCPTLLMVGEYEQSGAGAAKRLNEQWAANTGFPLIEITNSGHNANRDNPEMVNRVIEKFICGNNGA